MATDNDRKNTLVVLT